MGRNVYSILAQKVNSCAEKWQESCTLILGVDTPHVNSLIISDGDDAGITQLYMNEYKNESSVFWVFFKLCL